MPRTAFGLLILACCGCGGSYNKGKIEGKWLFVSEGDGPGALVFSDEGQVRLVRPDAPKPIEWRYKLLAGDAADFYDLPPNGLYSGIGAVVRVSIRIGVNPGESTASPERREMTLTDPTGRERRLVRVP